MNYDRYDRKMFARDYASELVDSNYSILGKVTNGVLGAGALMGSSRAKNMLKQRALKAGRNKVLSGAAGVVASKTGIDKGSVDNLIKGGMSLTGADKGLNKAIGIKPGFKDRAGDYMRRKRQAIFGRRSDSGGSNVTAKVT